MSLAPHVAAPSPDRLDQRAHPRHAVRLRVELAGAAIIAETQDLSEGGMFVEADDPLAVGSLLPVTLHLPDGRLETTAVIMRCVPGSGMGMRFGSASAAARARLARFLAER